jgi:hypothetical protein
MSTVQRAANVGDEFPVLLRLPDLNAPLWAPAPAIAPQAAQPISAVSASESTFRLDALAQAATSSSTETAEVATSPTDSTTSATSAVPAQVFALLARAWQGEFTNFPQWSLVRRIATGGVLVGGLALTFYLFSGGNKPSAPDTGPATQRPGDSSIALPGDAPLAVTPLQPNKPGDETSPAESHIAKVGPPPNFDSGWDASPAQGDRRIDAREGRMEGGFDNRVTSPMDVNHSRIDVTVHRDERPWNSPTGDRASITAYPTTDPQTYIYRAGGDRPAQSERADMARRLDGIAPPPRR